MDQVKTSHTSLSSAATTNNDDQILEFRRDGPPQSVAENYISLSSNSASEPGMPLTNQTQLVSDDVPAGLLLEADSQIMKPNHTPGAETSFDLFVNGSTQNCFSNAEFNDLDFFELIPGLAPDQVPAFAFPNNFDGFDSFSPLDQVTTSSHVSTQALEDATQRPPEEVGNSRQILVSQVTETATHVAPSQTTNLPDNISARLPRVVQDSPAKQPTLDFNETVRAALVADLSSRLSPEQSKALGLMSSTSLQKCLRTYVDCFHAHLPMFHFQSFDPEHTPSPLLLGMCAIGALFRLERRVAASLYSMADQALQNVLLGTSDDAPSLHRLDDWVRPKKVSTDPNWRPIWVTQCKLLLTFFAAFCGDPLVVRKAIEGMGMLSTVLETHI